MAIITKSLDRYAKDMSALSRAMRKAEVRAVRKAGITVRKVGSQTTRAILNVTAKTVNDAVTMRADGLRLRFRAENKPLPIRISTGVGYRANKTLKGITFKPYRAGGRLLLKGAFAHPGTAGGRVFKRVGKARLPIRPLFGPSVLSEFDKPKVRRAMDETWGRRIDETLRQEENFALKKSGYSQ